MAAEGINPFPQWGEVVKLLQEKDPMLYTYLKKSKGYFDGTRVLIDGGKTFRDFIRANKDSQRLIKKLIAQVSGVAVPIGPYEPKNVHRPSANAEESLHKLEQLGLDVQDNVFLPIILINDGRVLTDNLRQAGRDDRWLAQELHRQGIARSQDVFLLSVDQHGTVVCLRKEAAR